VKQLLLRVSDDLHARLTARAAREGRSVNQLAGEVLDVAANVRAGDERSRVRAKAAALGILAEDHGAPAIDDRERAALLASSRGRGPVIDEFLHDERDLI
jgi:plasmid stability protein